ncbi:hypothetical protein [Mycolicibacterium mageritense]|uniref:hypothetical protein n=1 Tax=Mycolicibacterium mageritense TaxID=53462 RepID=UPI001E2A7614|nr:hypothetical protein [Mycolicibacterium mageritense]MCC9182589.1 hypothetical protein [Mycolicibacterium mageritense]
MNHASAVERPKIPVTCESRPTVAGFVVPWANVQLADGGVDFRSQHESRVQRCWLEYRCQLCGSVIRPPIVFFGGPRQLAALTFDEPPLHPECAVSVYASKACPMVAGRLDHYASRDTVTEGDRGTVCPDPECDCGGWVPTPGINPAPGGDPAHDWYAVYVSDYSVAVSPDRPDRVHSGVVTSTQVLWVRHVSTPGVGRVWKRTSLEFANGQVVR